MRLLNFALILSIALGIAAYAHWIRRPKATTDLSGLPTIPATDVPLLRLADARALHADPATLFVDVRSASDFSFGRIAGAVSLPEEEIEKRLPELRSRLEHAKAIVVYCGSRDCGKSLWGALRLRQAGFAQTSIFPGGWNEWYVDSAPIDR
ncbi:MAG TPA: rhodanese-like domain-containing protein [Gemmataceae bacterium]|nr:rhodanese-like domain-containing protein [Gemmataceae bacterium]